MNWRTSFFAFLLFVAFQLISCTPEALNKTLNSVLDGVGEEQLTTEQIIQGLKEALVQGAVKGSNIVSAVDGYYKNDAIKILFPPEAQKIEKTLTDIGFGNLTEHLVEKINRAAEDAAKEAAPIFKKAITEMTITDAMNILMGDDTAATAYLRRTTSTELYNTFSPIIVRTLNKQGALNAWTDIVTKYNKVPLVQKMNPKLEDYVAKKAMNGLFLMIAKEETLIRKDPIARTTELLKKVFAKQDKK